MLNQLLMVFGVLCGLLGAALLFGTSDASVLAGGAMLSLGMVLASISLRAWLNWRKYVKTREIKNAEPASNFEPQAVTGPLALEPPIHRSPQERRRSQRIMVQVAVFLRIETPDWEDPPPLLTFTAWVNAHGGLLESPAKICAGQKITLIIPQSRKEAGCRVLKVQELSEDAFATAFEFDRQNPQFWPIASPPPDWSVASKPAS